MGRERGKKERRVGGEKESEGRGKERAIVSANYRPYMLKAIFTHFSYNILN